MVQGDLMNKEIQREGIREKGVRYLSSSLHMWNVWNGPPISQ